MSFHEKYLKYKSKYFSLKNQIGGFLKIGDRVIERDNEIMGTIIEIILDDTHDRFKDDRAVMKGDDGKKYNYNVSHYRLITDENYEDIKIQVDLRAQKNIEDDIKSKQEARARGQVFEGDRVIETDSLMMGTITKIDYTWRHPNGIMEGDDGIKYHKPLDHYILLTDVNHDYYKKQADIRAQENIEADIKSKDRARARGQVFVGDRVRERDCLMKGTIIAVIDDVKVPRAIMLGDDNKTYEHSFSHYRQLKTEIPIILQHDIDELAQEKKELDRLGIKVIGSRAKCLNNLDLIN